jgi:hypothetical protein
MKHRPDMTNRTVDAHVLGTKIRVPREEPSVGHSVLQQGADDAVWCKTMNAPILSGCERRRIIWTVIAAALLILAASISSRALQLNSEALTGWNEYIQAQSARIAEAGHATSFLWSDQSPDRIRRLREGEILVAPMGESPRILSHALIHHWIGAVFLPNTKLEDVLTVVRDYDKYKQFYAPYVVDSRLMHQAGNEDAFSMRILNNAVIAKFALEADFQTSFSRVDANRWYSVGYSTRIREIKEYGQPDQYELVTDIGHGLVWRLYNASRFEERDGGVYIELEAAALSRDVPSAFRWLVNPAVRRASRSSMLRCLQKTQTAVLASNRRAIAAARKPERIEEKSPFTKKTVDAGVDGGFAMGKASAPRDGSQGDGPFGRTQ